MRNKSTVPVLIVYERTSYTFSIFIEISSTKIFYFIYNIGMQITAMHPKDVSCETEEQKRHKKAKKCKITVNPEEVIRNRDSIQGLAKKTG
jgi:hypothetical protein